MTNTIEKKLISFLNSSNQSPAITINQTTYSYSQLSNLVNEIISEIEIVNADHFGIYAEKSIHAYASIIACFLCHKCFIPLHPQQTEGQLHHIISVTNLEYLLISKEKSHQLKGPFKKLQTSFDQTSNHSSPKKSEYAYILFTSGTTGNPKCVPIKRKSLLAYLKEASHFDPIEKKDVCSQFFELTFDLAYHDIFCTFSNGAHLIAVDQENYLTIPDLMTKHKVNHWFSVPTLAKNLLDLQLINAHSLSSLKTSLFCGEPLTKQLVEKWFEYSPKSKIFNLYGPTEATIACFKYECQMNNLETMFDIVSIGKPFQSIQFEIIEDELILFGEQLSDGYLEPTVTHSFFKDAQIKYRSGDLVSKNDNNNLFFRGRNDQQIKLAGNRLEILGIEHHIKRFLKEVPFLVVPLLKMQTLCLVSESKKIELKEVQHFLKDILPNIMIPKMIYTIQKIPVNQNGKMDRKKVLNEVLSSLDK